MGLLRAKVGIAEDFEPLLHKSQSTYPQLSTPIFGAHNEPLLRLKTET